MESNQISGLLSIILGLIFLICPIFSTAFLSIFIGLSLIFFGIAFILSEFSAVNIIVGILAILVGLVFLFNITALSFIFGLQFYIIGILMIIAGIVGIFSDSQFGKIASIFLIILGIISFALGGFSIGQPLFAAILIGAGLIIQGVGLYME